MNSTRFTFCAFGALLIAACAGQPEPRNANDAERVRGDTCASVVQAGVDADVVERLERASNVLEYESVWRAEHPGSAQGTIGGTEVRARIRSHASDIHGCYESALDRLPAGKGRVAVRFIVDADGGVPAVSIFSNDFQDPEVGCCVAKRVSQWRFPSPTNGGFVVVEYPFIVRTAKAEQ